MRARVWSPAVRRAEYTTGPSDDPNLTRNQAIVDAMSNAIVIGR